MPNILFVIVICPHQMHLVISLDIYMYILFSKKTTNIIIINNNKTKTLKLKKYILRFLCPSQVSQDHQKFDLEYHRIRAVK